MTHERTDPTGALDVLGNEIRMAILRELADAERTLSFTELRERVGVRDTGKFNYHLTRLCAYFVRQTEAGYELGHAGSRVITAADVGSKDERIEAADEDCCSICGEENCGKLFHVHLEFPWNR